MQQFLILEKAKKRVDLIEAKIGTSEKITEPEMEFCQLYWRIAENRYDELYPKELKRLEKRLNTF